MMKILVAAVLLTGAGVAQAQLTAPPATAGAGDGIQTRAEAVERVRTLFRRVDTDRDGAITKEEAAALPRQARGERRPSAADPARRARAFERLDSNRDNMISRDEWARANLLRGQWQAAQGRDGGKRLALRGRLGSAMLRAADANRDQRVTLQEAERAALLSFDRLDLDRDGQVSRQERQQRRQQVQQRRDRIRG